MPLYGSHAISEHRHGDARFYPSLVQMVWEADTSAPATYEGKTLYSAGSRLKIVAFPLLQSGSSLVPSSKLTFAWKRRGVAVPEQSGLGRNTFTFDGDQLQTSEDVSVDVYLGSNKVGNGEVSVPTSDPQVLFYNVDELRGELTNRALPSGITLSGNKITLQAEPYYFANVSKKRGSISYAWTLNGQETTGPDAARGVLVLQQNGGGSRVAQIGVAAQNNDSDKFVQSASIILQIAFGQDAGSALSSFFGL